MENKHEWKAGGVRFKAYADDASSGLLVGRDGDFEQANPWDWGGHSLAEVLRLAARVADLESVIAERGEGTPVPEMIEEELKLLRAWESAMLRWFDNDGGYVSVRLNSAEEDAKIAEEEAWTALCAFRERNKQEEKEG